MARFLFATMPIPGHVAPIAPVVRALVDRGHQVTWYTSAFFAEKVAASGAEFSPIVSTLDFGDADYDRHYPERVKYEGLQKLIFDFEHVFVGSVEGYVTDLRALIESNHPDALVVDPAVAAGWVIAETDGLPTAIVNITVLSLEDPGVAPFGLGLPPNSSLLGRVRNKALYALVDRVIFRKVNRAYRRLARAHGWPVLPFRPHATRWLYLQPSVPALEYPQVALPPQLHFIGPLLPTPADDHGRPGWWPDLQAARAARRPVVLVTQGTIATESDELIEPTLRALAEEDVLVIAAGADPAAMTSVPANARVVPFVPFVPLMPFVDAYVTNGGFGGVVIALANGVPVVSAGTTEDKAEVGGRIAYAGVGINLKTNRPTEDALRVAIFQVLRDPSYREKAARIQRDFADHDAPTEAAELLEQLASTKAPVIRTGPH